ncbi:Scr1 family TA system antitoxin-like transcriptional regulator [Streptomyces sp. NPDC001828]|uniref:Scr1 family TA system antitoxin-like transcriptional regulator n=1 Tax=Streptomyces sp. NPDC001828 TaxID=3364615 RepID=UPI0036BBAC7F
MRHLEGLAYLLSTARDRLVDCLPGWRSRLALCERTATSYLLSAGQTIPALLRTRGYAHAIRQAGWPEHWTELDAPLDRTLPVPGRQVAALLDEAILRRHVGGAATMADQIGHLIEQVETHTTTVLIVPLNSPTLMPSETLGHLLLAGGGSIFTTEAIDYTMYSTGLTARARRRDLMEALIADALPQPQSLERLRQLQADFSTAS